LNLKKNLKLEELAFLCNVSASTFKRKFVKLYNETPARYFLRKKMEMAKVLLLENANPIEVYYQVGYESHSSFSQSFKQMYGLSPKDFKQQYLICVELKRKDNDKRILHRIGQLQQLDRRDYHKLVTAVK
jgi:AraC-like DNA-binding protein